MIQSKVTAEAGFSGFDRSRGKFIFSFSYFHDSYFIFRVVKALQNESEFNLEGIRLLDRHKMVMQRWANYLFNRINRLDDGERERERDRNIFLSTNYYEL